MRLCFVEARGKYKKADKFCPTLREQTRLDCVVGTDPLDCVRRIGKGTAHFGVFTSEDLLAAEWAGTDLLITSEMRFYNGSYDLLHQHRSAGLIALQFFIPPRSAVRIPNRCRRCERCGH